MNMRKKDKEELLGKCALLWALDCVFGLNNGHQIYLDGYEYDSDRVAFQFDGHKCKLLEVNQVNLENGTVTLTVLAKGVELDEWTDVRVCFLAKHFRYDTLRKIVVEAYMCSGACHNDIWADDVDAFITEKCANWFDSYDANK